MIGLAGIEVIVEQRPSAVVGGALGQLAAKGGDPGGDPLPGHAQQQALPGAVILAAHTGEGRQINLPRRDIFRRQACAQQVSAGDQIIAVAPGDRHHQPGIVVVDDQRQLKDRFVVQGLGRGRRR